MLKTRTPRREKEKGKNFNLLKPGTSFQTDRMRSVVRNKINGACSQAGTLLLLLSFLLRRLSRSSQSDVSISACVYWTSFYACKYPAGCRNDFALVKLMLARAHAQLHPPGFIRLFYSYFLFELEEVRVYRCLLSSIHQSY